jgi:hypothetical protein
MNRISAKPIVDKWDLRIMRIERIFLDKDQFRIFYYPDSACGLHRATVPTLDLCQPTRFD